MQPKTISSISFIHFSFPFPVLLFFFLLPNIVLERADNVYKEITYVLSLIDRALSTPLFHWINVLTRDYPVTEGLLRDRHKTYTQ